MKIVHNMFGKFVQRLRPRREDEGATRKITMLSERVNDLERRVGAVVASGDINDTGSLIEHMDQILHAEIKSRERLERKLIKTCRKMDQLAQEFTTLQKHLSNSTVDLDLEKRKNTELRKRLDTNRNERKTQRK